MQDYILTIQGALLTQEELINESTLPLYAKVLLKPVKISPGSYFHLNLRTLASVIIIITNIIIEVISVS